MDDVSSEVAGRAAQRVVVVGGGPGGYESALVAAHLGADVTVVDRDGVGGAAVLTDCVPSKTLISTADFMSRFFAAAENFGALRPIVRQKLERKCSASLSTSSPRSRSGGNSRLTTLRRKNRSSRNRFARTIAPRS